MSSPDGSWSRAPVAQLVTRPVTYGVVKPGPEGDVPLIRATDLRDGRIVEKQLRTIGRSVDAAYARTRVEEADLLVGLVGSPGEVALVPKRLAGANLNRAVGLVRFDRSRVLPLFALYYWQGPGRARLLRDVVGSVQQVVNLRDLAQVEVVYPSIDEQRRIVAVLGAIDDRIDSNWRLTEALIEIVREKFHHHCVAVDDPNGIRVGLDDIARFVNGRAFTKDACGSGRPILRIKELNNGVSGATPRAELDAADDNIARHHDLLFSWSGSLEVYRWHGPEALINQHIFKVLPNDGIPVWFVECWIREHLPEFRGIAQDKATTMGHIKREHLRSAEVRLPSDARFRALDEVLSPLDAHIGALATETRTLAGVRDALLPKLVSGQIRVLYEDVDPVSFAA